MAIFHLGVNSIKRSMGGKTYSAALKHDYVCREGIYAERGGLEYSESGNMPEWAKDNPREFWESADAHARANGRLLTELEYALPHELNREEQIKLAQDFAEKMTTVEGGRLPYTFALHSPDQDNPNDHVHLEIAETIHDGHARDAETWFKRHDSKAPEISGAEKTREMLNKDFVEKAREAWADQCNRALAAAGHDVRITHLSLEAQGIERIPEIHVGYVDPARPEIHAERLARNNEIKAINAEMARASQEVESTTFDLAKAQAELKEIRATLDRAVRQHEREVYERAAVDRSFAEHGDALANKLQGELNVFTRGLSAESTRLNSELSRTASEHTNERIRENLAVTRRDRELEKANADKGRSGEVDSAKQSDVDRISWFERVRGKLAEQVERGVEYVKHGIAKVGEYRERRQIERSLESADGKIREYELGLPEFRRITRDQEYQHEQAYDRIGEASLSIADVGERLRDTSQELASIIEARDLAKNQAAELARIEAQAIEASAQRGVDAYVQEASQRHREQMRQEAAAKPQEPERPALDPALQTLHDKSREFRAAKAEVIRHEREREKLTPDSYEYAKATTRIERLNKTKNELGQEVLGEAMKQEKRGLDIGPAVAPLGPDVGQLRERMAQAVREKAEQIRREQEQALRKSRGHGHGHSM
ncbi:MAG: MobA/MobL family protein [Magnetococcales bacterium]|nr:MobA/MobL family protein [Magnetococcales bacterium]